jgi:tetratricopeptide (TPR) repeat protein
MRTNLPIRPYPTSNPSQWLQSQVRAHISARDWTGAAACLGRLLELHPGSAELLVQRSYMESLAGHYQAARQSAIDALKGNIVDQDVIVDLLTRLRTFNEIPELRRLIARLGHPSRIPIPVLLAAAAQCSYVNDQDVALALLDEARRADPEYPPTLLSRAQVLMYFARFEEAELEVERALTRAPHLAQGYWLLSKLRKQTTDRNHVSRLRAELARGSLSAADSAQLGIALHKELDDLGDFEAAWAALRDGLAAKRSTLRYNPLDTVALVDALTEVRSRGDEREVAPPSPMPIFIVGMHRSGTTLLEQRMSYHAEVHAAGELYDFTSAMRFETDHHCQGVIDTTVVQRARTVDLANVGRRYRQGLAWRCQGKAGITDKLPSNFLNIGFICGALPDAKILHMVRDPMETCFSNLRELFSDANPYSYDLGELGQFHRQYSRLMEHWRNYYPGRIIDVNYEALVAAPEKVMRDVVERCGLDSNPELMAALHARRAVATASAVQVRQEVAAQASPGWRRYEKHLEPLLRLVR